MAADEESKKAKWYPAAKINVCIHKEVLYFSSTLKIHPLLFVDKSIVSTLILEDEAENRKHE